MSGGAGPRVRYVPQPAQPALPRLPGGRARRAPIPTRPRPAGTRKRCWRRWSASRRRLVPGAGRGGPGAPAGGAAPCAAESRARAPVKARAAVVTGQPAARCSCCTRRSPPSPSRSGCRPSAGRLSCPCSGWRRTTMTSRDPFGHGPRRGGRAAHAALRPAARAGRTAGLARSCRRRHHGPRRRARAALPPGLHRDAACERIASCYRPGFSLSPRSPACLAGLPRPRRSTQPIPPSRSIWSRDELSSVQVGPWRWASGCFRRVPPAGAAARRVLQPVRGDRRRAARWPCATAGSRSVASDARCLSRRPSATWRPMRRLEPERAAAPADTGLILPTVASAARRRSPTTRADRPVLRALRDAADPVPRPA